MIRAGQASLYLLALATSAHAECEWVLSTISPLALGQIHGAHRKARVCGADMAQYVATIGEMVMKSSRTATQGDIPEGRTPRLPAMPPPTRWTRVGRGASE